MLGEWKLTANMTENSGMEDYFGPLTMTHVGICTQEGPEKKTGEIRLQLSSSRVQATLLVDGVECSYSGRRSNPYTGELRCPGRPVIPLAVWLK